MSVIKKNNFKPNKQERSAKTLGYTFNYLPGNTIHENIVSQMLSKLPPSYYFCYCRTTYPDGSKEFVLYLRKRKGKYHIRSPEKKEDIYLNGEKYTAIYNTVLKLEDKISEVLNNPDISYESNFPGLGEETTYVSEEEGTMEESTEMLEKGNISKISFKGADLVSPEVLKVILDKWNLDKSCDLLIIELQKDENK